MRFTKLPVILNKPSSSIGIMMNWFWIQGINKWSVVEIPDCNVEK